MSQVKNANMLYMNSVDLENRRIYLLSEVDDMVVAEILKSMHLLAKSPGPIEFWICSGGGELEPSLGLYDAIQRLDPDVTPIHTIATGQACSAALLLLACGHKRSAAENCWAMAHTTHGAAVGDSDAMTAQVAVTMAMTEQMWHLLSLHTKRTAKQWKAIAKEHSELWMNPTEMIEYGIIDEIVPPHPNRKFQKRPPVIFSTHSKAKPKRKRAPATKKPAKPPTDVEK
jgi:ATP-dependent Clp endopeptidase proteolytic subunit ClpP